MSVSPSRGPSSTPTPRLGFCSCERRVAEQRIVIPKDENPLLSVRSQWAGWLQEWEEKQRREFRLHEKHTKDLVVATKALVEELRNELMDKLGQLERASTSGGPPRRFSQAAGSMFLNPDEEKDNPLESKVNSNRSVLQSVGTNSAAVKDGAAKGEDATYDEINKLRPMNTVGKAIPIAKMNDAMTAACGGARKAKTADAKTFESAAHVHHQKNYFQHVLLEIVDHEVFNLTSGALILIYSIVVGIMADIEMRAAVSERQGPAWRWYVDIFFTSSFILEALLNLLARGLDYFIGKDWKWNIFDLVVALVGLMDIIRAFDLVNLGFMRILRTIRAVRILRVIRIFSIFKELRVMIASILCCLPSLTWAFTLLVAVIYIFAVILMQGASEYLLERTVEESLKEPLGEDFGDIARTMYSLIQAVSGGRSWGEFAAPFVLISPWYGVVFTMFVIFVIFGVLNILTGVFVEGTTSLANVDKELVIQEEMARHESVIGQIRMLFKELDVDESGTLSYAELTRNLADDRVKAYFAMLQMDVSEARGLFQLLDRDESGEVSIEEFIMTCMRLKGNARSIDLATMLFESKRLHTVIKHFMRSVDRSNHDISDKLQMLQKFHEDAFYQ